MLDATEDATFLPANPKEPRLAAQGMGAAMSTAALAMALVLGLHTAANGVLIAFVLAAGLESIFAYCLGCKVTGLLMRVGVVPQTVCAECGDISVRPSAAV